MPHSPLHWSALRADQSDVSRLLRLIARLRPGRRFAVRRGAIAAAFALSISASGHDGATGGGLAARDHTRDGVLRFRREMPLTIRAEHPAILPVAAAIRAVTQKPLEQIAMVNDVTHLLVDYDSDKRVYGIPECQATLDEMIARRREAGWLYLRDDCDGRAVFAAHLLAALGIPWRLEASYWQAHAWVVARVEGIDYDLLAARDSRPEEKELMYRVVGRHFVRVARPPPYFPWHEAWRSRTASDITLGKRLGLLELDSTPGHLRERTAVDWTRQHPSGDVSPFDPRTLLVSSAGFPFGEPLHSRGLARATLPNTPASFPDKASDEAGTLTGARSK